jgi:hypothetical protein
MFFGTVQHKRHQVTAKVIYLSIYQTLGNAKGKRDYLHHANTQPPHTQHNRLTSWIEMDADADNCGDTDNVYLKLRHLFVHLVLLSAVCSRCRVILAHLSFTFVSFMSYTVVKFLTPSP